ncbi:hypothetical protein D3C86_1269150 [compost metagenome]
MLRDQHVAGFGALLVHAADVGHHVALEQIEQATNGVQQNRVMAGLGNRQVELGIRRALFRPTDFIVPRIAVLQFIEGRSQSLAIHISST